MDSEKDLSQLSRLEVIEHLAGLHYGPREIALYLRENAKRFLHAWQNADSPEREAYDRGMLISEIEVNQAIQENAKAGNITAAQIFKKNQLEKGWQNAFSIVD